MDIIHNILIFKHDLDVNKIPNIKNYTDKDIANIKINIIDRDIKNEINFISRIYNDHKINNVIDLSKKYKKYGYDFIEYLYSTKIDIPNIVIDSFKKIYNLEIQKAYINASLCNNILYDNFVFDDYDHNDKYNIDDINYLHDLLVN